MNQSNSKTALVSAQQKALEDKKNQLNSMSIGTFMNTSAIKNRVMSMLGSDRGLKFITSVTSAVNANSKLAECTNDSIFNAALLGESLNLSPSPQLGQIYIIPFKDKNKGMVAQFQLGYKGYIQLAIRSGNYKKINVVEVKEGEFIDFDIFNEEIHFSPITDYVKRQQAPTIGYYAMFEYLNGFKKSIYMSKEEMLEHADTYSQAFSKDSYEKLLREEIPTQDMWKYSSFWYKNFDEMAKKTMLRQLISKWGIMSTEMQKAFEADMALQKDDGTYEYIDTNPENGVEETSFVQEATYTINQATGEVKEEKKVEEEIEEVNIDEL